MQIMFWAHMCGGVCKRAGRLRRAGGLLGVLGVLGASHLPPRSTQRRDMLPPGLPTDHTLVPTHHTLLPTDHTLVRTGHTLLPTHHTLVRTGHTLFISHQVQQEDNRSAADRGGPAAAGAAARAL